MDTNTVSPATSLPAAFRAIRARSRQLFGLLNDEAYYSQPIDLRHPIIFYDGHLPAFSFNTLVKRALGRRSIDARLEALFARGIDPDTDASADGSSPAANASRWPDRATVRAFIEEADRRVLDALANDELDRPGHPLLDRAEAAHTILEHEAMHQETLLYMWHRLALARKRKPAGYEPKRGERPPRQEWVPIPDGDATLGVSRDEIPFGWDNEFPRCTSRVDRFSIERHNVTNAAFLEFVEAGGYRDERWWRPEDWSWLQQNGITHPLFWESDGGWFWRGMFDLIPLPPSWPVFVSHAEA